MRLPKEIQSKGIQLFICLRNEQKTLISDCVDVQFDLRVCYLYFCEMLRLIQRQIARLAQGIGRVNLLRSMKYMY